MDAYFAGSSAAYEVNEKDEKWRDKRASGCLPEKHQNLTRHIWEGSQLRGMTIGCIWLGWLPERYTGEGMTFDVPFFRHARTGQCSEGIS